jgi:hypothetical protein
MVFSLIWGVGRFADSRDGQYRQIVSPAAAPVNNFNWAGAAA